MRHRVPTATRWFAVAIFLTHQNCYAAAPVYFDLVGLILWIVGALTLLFAGIGAMLSRSRWKGALVGALVFVTCLVSWLVWLGHGAKKDRIEQERVVAARDALADQVDVGMASVCEAEERLVINKTLAPGYTLLLSLPPDVRPPTAASAPAVVSTDQMKDQQRRLGWSWPPSSNDDQYKQPVSWIKTAEFAVTEVARAGAVDRRGQSGVSSYSRSATKEQWKKSGAEEIAIAYTEKYLESLKFRNWPDGKFVMDIPVQDSDAQYELTVEDVSTLVDRSRWVARGRIRLTDRTNAKVVAEYVGFQSLLRRLSVCPNAKIRSEAIQGPGRDLSWYRDRDKDIFRYFFSQVVR